MRIGRWKGTAKKNSENRPVRGWPGRAGPATLGSAPLAHPVSETPRSRPLALAATLLAVLSAATLPSLPAGQDWDAVQIGTQALGDGVYMLTGQGGNIGVSVGDDGVFVVDDQFAPLTDKILAAIRAVTPRPVRWVFNTHWHGDHVENAHTDGDAIVHFRRANVVHVGDIYFRDTFPFIDTATGGCIDGMAAAADAGLALMDADTKVIPGHGALATREELRAYRDALKAIRDLAERWGQDETAERLFVHTIYWCLGGR